MGVLPLIICFSFSALQFFPAYQRHEAEQWGEFLTARFGVDVAVAAYQSQAPRQFTLHGIQLRHPETRVTLGRVQCVEVEFRKGRWMIAMDGVELEARHASGAWKVVHDWFLCRPTRYTQAARFSIREFTIRAADADAKLHDISIDIEPTPEAMLLEFAFRQQPAPKPAQAESEKAKLIVKRHHDRKQLRTELQLRTGTSPLPCSLAGELFPMLSILGAEATFQGTLDLDLVDEQWHARVTNGALLGIELDKLTRGMGTAMIGRGDVILKTAEFGSDGLRSARGEMVALPGDLTHNLSVAFNHDRRQLRTELQLRTGTSPVPCSLAGELFPMHSMLGAEATFQGALDLALVDEQWHARVTNGTLRGLELDKLTREMGTTMIGQGEVILETAVLGSDGLQNARGRLVAHSGNLTHSLFVALNSHFGFQLREQNPVQTYAFDHLEWGFDIHPSRLHLIGVISDARGILALRDTGRWEEDLPLVSIADVLNRCERPSAESSPQVPVGKAAQQALVWLPLDEGEQQTAARRFGLSQNH